MDGTVSRLFSVDPHPVLLIYISFNYLLIKINLFCVKLFDMKFGYNIDFAEKSE